MMRKGASLIWAIVLSTTLFAIAVTTSSFVIKESQLSVRMDGSAQAYAAAESGLEWGKYCLDNLAICSTGPTGVAFSLTTTPNRSPDWTFVVGESTYTVTLLRTNTETILESLGTSGDINRKLEYTAATSAQVAAGDLTTNPTMNLNGSYKQQFDYWTDGTGSGEVGVKTFGGGRAIAFRQEGNVVSLVAKFPLDPDRSRDIVSSVDITEALNTAGVAIDDIFALNISISYIKDLSATMVVSVRPRTGASATQLTCAAPTLVLDLSAGGFPAMGPSAKYYFSPAAPVVDASFAPLVVYSLNSATAPVRKAYVANVVMTGITP